MYKIERRKAQTMRFMLGNKEISFPLPESLTPDKLAEAQGALAKAAEITDETKYAAVGNATIKIIQLVFGGDIANEIIKFFENDYVEMVEQVFPYINYEVIPAMRNSSKERAKSLKKLNRK